MKKLLALAALVLGMVSCQTEPEGLDVNVGGEVDAVVTVSLPETETRAGGVNSALGAFENVDWNNYTVRYILKIYDANGRVSDAVYETYLDGNKGKSVTFPVRLVPNRDYSFVAWADIVRDNDKRDLHYNTSNLPTITIIDSTWVAMDETRDAFTDVETLRYYGNTAINLELTRPFAKLRVKTTDIKDLTNLNIAPDNAVLAYDTPYYTSFNALTKEYTKGNAKKTHTYTISPYTADNNDEEMILFTDYLFVENDIVKFNLTVNESNCSPIKENNFTTDIPVKRNFLTTISGHILTDGNNVSVEVKDGFENKDNTTEAPYYQKTISSADEFLAALNTAGEFIVISDINIANAGDTVSNGQVNTFATRAGEINTLINLNGHIIKVNNTSDDVLATVEEGHKVTIVGEGTIELTDESTESFIANTEGALEIADVVIVDNNNTTVIEGEFVDYADLLRQAFEEGCDYKLVYNVIVKDSLTLEAGKTMVLDLNGKTIKGYDEGTASYGLIVNKGNLTVKNGTITLEASENRGWNAYSSVISNSCGTLIVEDGAVIEHLGGTDMAYGIDNLSGSKAAKATINGGHIKSTYRAIRQFLNSDANQNELTVNGGVIEGANKSIWMQDPSKKSNLGKLTVGANAQLKGDVYLFVTAGSTEWPVEVSIANAAFDGESTVVTGNVPAIYNVDNKDGIWTVEKCYDVETNENGVTVYTIKGAAGMTWFAEQVDNGETFEGNIVKLGADIDLYKENEDGEAVPFDPIGSYRFEKAFMGIFDGQNHTISNLNQNTWELNNGYYYNDCGLGLFGALVDAKICNLNIDEAHISGESALCGIITAYAENTTFENITVKNSDCADYQYYAGGIAGWVSGTNNNYINCNIDATTTVAAQWGDFDNSIGGVIGGASGSSEIFMKDCNVACRIDAYNDVTSSYQWYAYRRCGMLIGNSGKTETVDGHTRAIAPQLTCENVTVTYGEWANYTYCEFAGTSWPYVRVQAGISNSAYSNPRYGHPTDANGNTVVDDNHVHNEGEDHHILCVFDQLYGGGQGVYGTPTHEGVTVVYNNK